MIGSDHLTGTLDWVCLQSRHHVLQKRKSRLKTLPRNQTPPCRWIKWKIDLVFLVSFILFVMSTIHRPRRLAAPSRQKKKKQFSYPLVHIITQQWLVRSPTHHYHYSLTVVNTKLINLPT
jgi:hypothetical protein